MPAQPCRGLAQPVEPELSLCVGSLTRLCLLPCRGASAADVLPGGDGDAAVAGRPGDLSETTFAALQRKTAQLADLKVHHGQSCVASGGEMTDTSNCLFWCMLSNIFDRQ